VPKYIITKQFRDVSGVRFPGEIIELTPSRAAVLRESGLIGGEYIPEQEPEQQPEPQEPEVEDIKEEAPKESPRPKKKGKAGK
jgi:hypothetical protein